jgi:hypothetical protein
MTPSPSNEAAALAAAVKLQEQLLAQERELDSKESAIATWEDGLVSYPIFMPKPSTHRVHDPGSIVPNIRHKSVHK